MTGMCCGVFSRMDAKKKGLQKRWTAYSKYDMHSMLDSQHDCNWVGLYDHLISMRIFTLIKNYIYIYIYIYMSSKIYEEKWLLP